MPFPRCILFAAASLALVIFAERGSAADAAAALPAPTVGFRAPYVPPSDSQPLQDVPSARDPAVARMRALRAAAADPHNLAAAITLAQAYIDYGRQIGDAHYAGYAEAVIAPWVKREDPPANALITQATILQYRHDFDGARRLLRAALQRDPRSAQAWLTVATLDMVQGDYASANKDCGQVANDAGLDVGLACLGNLRSYTGQARQSLELLRRAEAAGATATVQYRAWVEGLIAETAERLGDWPLAEQHYRAALNFLPHDNFLLVAYADFLLDRGRPAEVLPLLADHVQSDTAFLRIALAQAAVHDPQAARSSWIMAARFAALVLRGSDYFGREEARFALELQHDPQTALELARRNWQLQRAPPDARVFLQAALAAHEPDAAAAVVDFLTATQLEDPVIVPLARQIARSRKDPVGARR